MQVGQTQDRKRLAVVVSLAAHMGLAALVLGAWAGRPAYEPPAEPPPMPVMLVQPPPPPPDPSPSPPAGPASAAPPAPAPPPLPVRMARPQSSPVAPLLVIPAPAPEPVMTLSDGELVGARTAGSGSEPGSGGEGAGGQPCDMVRRLQAALRRDRQVQAAAGEAHRAAAGRGALLVWNGDWIRSPGESGKGLAGIRQAIALEVAFAPEACRAEPMRGLVLLTLADGPGAPRLALGSGQWRWSDLLQSRGAVAPRRG